MPSEAAPPSVRIVRPSRLTLRTRRAPPIGTRVGVADAVHAFLAHDDRDNDCLVVGHGYFASLAFMSRLVRSSGLLRDVYRPEISTKSEAESTIRSSREYACAAKACCGAADADLVSRP